MTELTLSRDINGNKTLKFKPEVGRGFSVQTNGNLPNTHRMTKEDFNMDEADNELSCYVRDYGTRRQKDMFGYW